VPPAVSAVTVSSILPTGATISWTTDQPADTQVDGRDCSRTHEIRHSTRGKRTA
jgi:hypothetical protein